MTLSREKINNLIKAGYSVDEYLTYSILFKMKHLKVKAISVLYRSDMVVKNHIKRIGKDNSLIALNLKGIEHYMTMTRAATNVQLELQEKQFEEMWNTYPASNSYEFHPRTRGLRGGTKDAIRAKYFNLLKEYKHEDMLEATKKYVDSVKLKSDLSGKNELSFMPNMSRYLNEKTFLSFMSDTEVKQQTHEIDVV